MAATEATAMAERHLVVGRVTKELLDDHGPGGPGGWVLGWGHSVGRREPFGPLVTCEFPQCAQPTADAGWPASAVVARSRYWPGVTPTSAVKSRVKWAWSYQP